MSNCKAPNTDSALTATSYWSALTGAAPPCTREYGVTDLLEAGPGFKLLAEGQGG